MKIYQSIDDFSCTSDTVVTIGTFDGVHEGHKIIIKRVIEITKNESKESVLLTFSPHPRNVLFPEGDNLTLLNTDQEKIKKLEELGIDHLIIQDFTKDFSRIKPVNFIRDILINKLRMKYMIVGYDHHFGRNREGSFEELNDLSLLYSFSLERVQAQVKNNITISSTKIRNMLLNGDVKKANMFLGEDYSISGKVVHGEKIGRTIGFPTANILFKKNKLIPKCGVYVVKVIIDHLKYFGMLNIDCNTHKLEVHIFNFSKDIYDKKITIKLIERLRDNNKFDSLNELKSQLIKDKDNCNKFLELKQ